MTETLMHTIVKMMVDAQTIHNNGEDKKKYVLENIKKILDIETYEKYEPLISLIIDFIKYVATNKEILNGLKHNLSCLSCIK
jgi:hypothetical protein